MKPFGFVYRHGWSFDARALAALALALEPLTPHRILDDCGYWTAEPAFPEPARDVQWVAVGHSYGFAGLINDRRTPWRAAIGIGAFLQFPQSGLTEFMHAVACEPRRAAAAFQRRCRIAKAHALPLEDAVGSRRMLHDLQALQRLALVPPAIPQLYLHGARDAVVPPMAESIVHPHAGHSLGIDEIPWCTARITEFIRSLSP